ncbi:response regulator transcription factor [Nisaea sp.]|uniref:response regulator transcription factor n=1 Tax=Nisaea sp. TaxID=2024842 RepID=UPI0032EC4DB0
MTGFESDTGRILLVEDNDAARDILSAILVSAGYQTTTATTLAEARTHIEHEEFDVVVIDLQLPDGNGLSLINPVRQNSNAGIVVATASADFRNRLVGLESGADEYLEKPVHPRELVARIRNLMTRLEQRRSVPEATRFEFDGWFIDLIARKVFFDSGASENLTESEFRIMEVLVRNCGHAVHRDRILAAMDEDGDATPRAVDKALYRTRLKLHAHLGSKANIIETVHGVGYRLVASFR